MNVLKYYLLFRTAQLSANSLRKTELGTIYVCAFT